MHAMKRAILFFCCLISTLHLVGQSLSVSASDTSVCSRESVWLTVDTQGISPLATYLWKGAAGSNFDFEDSHSTYVLPPQSPGFYWYYVTVTDPVRGVLTDSIQIRNRGFTVTLPNDTAVGCTFTLYVQAQISNNSSPVNFYTWSNGSNNYQAINLSETGTYRVTATDDSGCTEIDSMTISSLHSMEVSFTLCKHYFETDYPQAFNTITYLNTSPITAGWDWGWTFDGNQSDTIIIASDSFTIAYNRADTYHITLQADSADCSFQTYRGVIPEMELCNPVGLAANGYSDRLTIYPTITRDKFYVESNVHSSMLVVGVYSLQGRQLILTETLGHEAIDISTLPAGQYFVSISTATAATVQRIMKY